jgi:hypothetical protein
MKTLTSLSLGLTDFLYDDLAIVFLLEVMAIFVCNNIYSFLVLIIKLKKKVLGERKSQRIVEVLDASRQL